MMRKSARPRAQNGSSLTMASICVAAVADRENDPAIARNLAARDQEVPRRVVFLQEPDVLRHRRIDLRQVGLVDQLDHEHAPACLRTRPFVKGPALAVNSSRDQALALAVPCRPRRHSRPPHADRRRRLRRALAAAGPQAVAPRQARRCRRRRTWTTASPSRSISAREETAVRRRFTAFESTIDPLERTPVNRYHAGSLSHPSSAGPRLEPVVRDRAGGDSRRRAADSRPDRLALQHARSRRGACASTACTRWRCACRATARSHRAWSRPTWQDWLAAVRVGVRHVRSKIPEGRAAHPRRLLERRRAGAEVHARRARRRRRSASGEADPAVADDRRHARGAAGVVDQPPRRVPYFEKANWLDVLPEYNPFKYNSFAANAGVPDRVADARAAGRPRARRRQRPARRMPADPDLSVDRRCDGEHAGGRAHALRSAAGERQRAGAVRRQSSLGDRRVPAAGRPLAGRPASSMRNRATIGACS